MKFTTARLVAICATSTVLFGCASHTSRSISHNHCQPNYGAVAVGTIAGGLVGSSIGGGAGRDLAIAAGATTGAYIAHDASCK